MKIALLHHSVLPPKNYGGIERVVMTLATQYQQLGHEVVIACAKGSKIPDFETLHLPENYASQAAQSWLPAGIDFLHSHEPLRIRPKIPFLVTIHGNGQVGEPFWPNTNFLSQSHARNHSASRYVYNGIDINDYPLESKKGDYYVFLAKASWRIKNLKSCIDFVHDVGSRLEVIGGTGRSTARVRYRGLIGEREGKLEILSRAKALLYPTNWNEPFGLAVVEALACGTPVIASMNGAMPEVVGKEAGVTCQTYRDFVQAAKSIETISHETCRRWVEENFTAEKMTKSYLQLINEILNSGELKQKPEVILDNQDPVHLIYKPSLANKLRVKLTGKI